MKNNINVEEIIDGLYEKLKEGKSEHYQKYIKFLTSFYDFSFRNTLLIFSQNPYATRVAGFVEWKKKGFVVKKGEKAINIFAPTTVNYIIKDNKKVYLSKMSKEEKKSIKKSEIKKETFFIPVKVFDLSQVKKVKETPENEHSSFFYNIGNTKKEMYYQLKTIIENNNISVIENVDMIPEGTSSGGTIRLKKGLDYNNKLLTLIHEYAHELLDHDTNKKKQNKNIKELRAESISYIVGSKLGLESPFSTDYILGWSSKEDLLNHLEEIKETSKFILNQIKDNQVENNKKVG